MSKSKKHEEFKLHKESEEYFSRPKKIVVNPKNEIKYFKNINTKDLKDLINDNEDNYLL